ncbi:MAG: hypothetical protein V1743_00335 [Nanoarchaeota archaeon]
MALKKKRALKKAFHGFLFTVGFLLSPLSWWNDVFVNIPLAYAFAVPFSLLRVDFFLPAFVIGYLLTNILGLLLLHHGIQGIFAMKRDRRRILKDVLIALIYTALIVLLVVLGVIRSPQAYFAR